MVSKKSPKRPYNYVYNNYVYDGRVKNILNVDDILNPTYVKPIRSVRTSLRTLSMDEDGDEVRKPAKSPRKVKVKVEEEDVIKSPKKQSKKDAKLVDDDEQIKSKKELHKEEKKMKKTMVKDLKDAKFDDDDADDKQVISTIDKFFGTILTCKEVKRYLEFNPYLSTTEKIEFIEKNSRDARSLKAYLTSQHWSVKELTYYYKASKFIKGNLVNGIKNTLDYFSVDTENSTPECKDVENMLKQLKEQKRMEEWRNKAWDWLKWLGSTLYNATSSLISTATSYLYSGIKNVFSLLLDTGFEIYKFIMKNPKLAKYTLITLVFMKKRLCRSVGSFIRSENYITKEDLKKGLQEYRIKERSTNPNKEVKLEDELTTDAFASILKNTITKSMNALSNDVGGYMGTAVVGLLGGATLLSGGTAAPLTLLIGTCVTKVVSIAMEEVADSVEEGMIVAQRVKDSDTCFSLLLELINPYACLDQMLKGYQLTDFQIEKDAKNAEEKAKVKELEELEKRKTQLTEEVTAANAAKQKKIDEQYNKAYQNAPWYQKAWMATKRSVGYRETDVKFDQEESNAEFGLDGKRIRRSNRKSNRSIKRSNSKRSSNRSIKTSSRRSIKKMK